MVFEANRLEEPVSFPKNGSEWHSWLDGYVEDALVIREYVDSLPETAATFGLRRVNDELSVKHDLVPDGVVKLTGAWPRPDVLPGSAQGMSKWVNPNYIHSQHYSDTVAMCDCGIPVLREYFGDKEKQPAHHQDHKDDCNKIYRKRARLELLENRKEIIKDVYYHGHSLRGNKNRLGYGPNVELGSKTATDVGIDLQELRMESRKTVARTLLVLSRDYKSETIGKLYGVSQSTVNRIIKDETVGTPEVMRSVRRRKRAKKYDYPKPTA